MADISAMRMTVGIAPANVAMNIENGVLLSWVERPSDDSMYQKKSPYKKKQIMRQSQNRSLRWSIFCCCKAMRKSSEGGVIEPLE